MMRSLVLAALALLLAAASGRQCPYASPDPHFVDAPWHDLEQRVELRAVHPVPVQHSGRTQDDPMWLTEQPGAMVYSGTMGSASVAGWAVANSTAAKFVKVRKAADASEALKFAAGHNLAVSVKNTGHDWFGRSARRGSLMLWTFSMKGMEWHDDFTPSGCGKSVGSTVTLGAGVQFWDLYEEATKRQRMVVGGTCSTVGHAGFTLGGGYGDYSRMYGSGATNLVEAEVVLADGQTVIANTCGPHADLFKALRGGGGAFGVMTRATYRTYPWPVGKLGAAEGKIHSLKGGVQKFLNWYAGIVRQGMAKHFGGQLQVGGGLGDAVIVELNYVGISRQECSKLFAGLSEVHCSEDPKPWGDHSGPWQPSWELHDASAYHTGSTQMYFDLEKAEDPAFAQGVARLSESNPKHGIWVALNYALGHGSETALAYADETSVHPQVYSAIGVLKVENLEHGIVPSSTTPINAADAATFAGVRSQLEALLPGAGTYYNEGDYLDKAFQDKYWGSKYPELLATKRKYDPENVFTCHQCVGSEFSAAPCGRRLSDRVGRGAAGSSGPVLV